MQKLVWFIIVMQPNRPEYWIAMFFVTGLVFGIGAALVVGFLWNRVRRSIIKQAEECGANLGFDTESSLDFRAIQGCGYLIGFIIVAVASILGMSLSALMPADAEKMVVVVAIVTLGAMLWGLTLWSIPYYRGEKRRFQHLLDTALAKVARERE